MKFTIVVPCYNCEQTIERCVNSLLAQKNRDGKPCDNYVIELVDDGSTDATRVICDRLEATHHNVRTVHKPNGGLVSAWKRGVQESKNNYILFCDSDDYVDDDLIITISERLNDRSFDMMVYGMICEYNNGDIVYKGNRLADGEYNREQIEQQILPYFFSDGTMESMIMLGSRCCKVFSRDLLLMIMADIPNGISIGEDQITTFAVVLNAKNICSIGEFYPYHYDRTNTSMTGLYESAGYKKRLDLYGQTLKIAKKYHYMYEAVINEWIVSSTLIYLKKDICKNPYGYRETKKEISEILDEELVKGCFEKVKIDHYDMIEKVFAKLLLKRRFRIAYYLTRAIDSLRGRSV